MKVILMHDSFPPMSFGGGGISTYEMGRGLCEAGHEVHVITTCRNKKDAGEFVYEGMRVYRLYSDYPERWRWYVSLYNPRTVSKIKDIFVRVQPDIAQIGNVHQHLSYHSFKIARKYSRAVLFIARDVMAFNYVKLETPLYLNELNAHTTWLDHIRQAGKRYNPLRNILIRHYLQYANATVAISEALKKALQQNDIRCDGVIYNGIHPDDWIVDDSVVAKFRAEHALEDKKVILFGGRLSAAKGAQKGIEALAEIVKEEPSATLLVVGKVDWYAEVMRKKAEDLGIASHVLFAGWLAGEELKAAYSAATLVWMLSICFDSFGRVNIEAMSSGKPVVGTCYGGTPEVVEDGKTGYVVNPLYPQQIADKTLALLQNTNQAQVFGHAGRERVERNFAMPIIIEETLDLYAKLLTI